MKNVKYLLLFVILLSFGFVTAQNVAIGFKDTTTGTKTAVNLEYGGTGYPFPTPTTGFDKWLVQFYKTSDDTINPLDSSGNPTEDDVECIAIGNFTQYLSFGPTGALALSAMTVAPSGSQYNVWAGDKIYVRIFNHKLKASATKNMAFTAPYTITSTATQNVTIIPTYGWGSWTTHGVVTTKPNPAVLVLPENGGTGLAFAGQTLSWTAGAKSAPTSYKVYFGTDGGGTATPVELIAGTEQTETTKVTGALLPNKTYYWQIVPKNSAGDAENCPIWSFTTRQEQNPSAANYLSPVNGASIEAPEVLPFDVTISWEAGAKVAPTGYKIYVGPSEPELALVFTQTETTFDIPIAVTGDYYWKVVPYYEDLGLKSSDREIQVTVRSNRANLIKGDATGNAVWHFTVTPHAEPPVIPADTPTDVNGGPAAGGATIDSEIDLYSGPAVLLSDPIIMLLTHTEFLVSPIILSYSGTGTTDLVITVGEGSWYGLVFYGGAWHFANLPDRWPLVVAAGHTATMTFFDVEFGAKGEAAILLNDGDNPLPVELSSFTAVLTSQYFINLTWVTESETEAVGFNVRRAETNNLASSSQINQLIIPATNSSQQQSYTMTDTDDLVVDHTYYYWLESIDLGGAIMTHGPVSARVLEQPVPTLPELSLMRSAYPNPLRMGASTNIEVNIKKGEKGTVTIYNILGQTVKTYNVNQGMHKINWNAKGCASGIYFYKLSTPSKNTTKKLVIVN